MAGPVNGMGVVREGRALRELARTLPPYPRVAQRDVHRQQKWLGNVLCCIQSMCREAELLSHGKPRKQGEQDGSSSRFVLDRLLALISLRNPWELPHFW